MRPEHTYQPLVLGRIFGRSLELVAARAERARRRVHQRLDRARRFLAGVDQILGQRADDPVAPRINLADAILVLARGLDDGACGHVDDRGHPARLCIERVSFHSRFRIARHECSAASEASRIESTLPTPDTARYFGARGSPLAAQFE